VKITWREEKNRKNKRKHKISFEAAQLVFDDPLHLTRWDRCEDGEERWQTTGMADGVVLLLVAHTYEETGEDLHVHIISARPANSHERKVYEQGT
jgi:uncharacterized DUF497 family protein|tara:strand:+ start:209 stop:493 length:285 start_codon:yes stop_codon:yes gene_type:complete